MQTLEQVKVHQKLAYESVVHVRGQLREGMTEKEAAALIEDFFHKRGHKLFFHRPFAWFGDRTGFKGFERPQLPTLKKPLPHVGQQFMPTDRKLEKGMAVTLDVAPAVNGFAVDIGYSFSFGENADVLKARQDLKAFREIILKAAQERVAIAEIYRRVEAHLLQQGYTNCHGIYPLGVLGHRVGQLPLLGVPKISVMGFHPQAYAYLIKEKLFGPAIMTADEKRPLSSGLWAIEPHLGRGEFGVKFEEILVVTTDSVYWLDDQLPHMTEV